MEIILFPIMFVVELIAHLFIAVLAVIFNFLLRSDKEQICGEEPLKLKPANPWFVFGGSLLISLVLAASMGAICGWYFGSQAAFWWGFGVLAFFGVFASVSAATGQSTA